MLTLIRLRQFYFFPLLAFIIIGLPFCFLVSKPDGFRLLNGYHNTWLNNFFAAYTNVGDGLVSVGTVIILLVLKKWKEASATLFAFICSGLAAQVLKNFFSHPRPLPYFEKALLHYPHFIDGITLHGNTSFPSGHTTTAFAMATVLALINNKKILHIFILLAAVLVAYSRIYLGQHFFEDVLAGACIGTFFGIAGYSLFFLQKRPLNFKIIPRKSKAASYKNENIQPVWN